MNRTMEDSANCFHEKIALPQSSSSSSSCSVSISWAPLDMQPDLLPCQPYGWALASLTALKPASFATKQSSHKLLLPFLGCDAKNNETAEQLMKQVPLIDKVGIGAVAGGIAGGFTNVVLHPLDTVKTKLQTRGSSALYSGPWDVVCKVLANQGVLGFYSGVQAAFVGSVMSSAIYFGTYELAKCIFSNVFSLPKTIMPPLAAALGNITSSAILVPKEVVKQRMQAGAAGSARQVFLHTIKSEGVIGLYAGYSAALLRNVPSNMISFSTFEYLKLAWLGQSKRSVLAPWQSVLSGALAGALSAAITTPLDVVKTRLMTQAHLALSSAGMTGKKVEAAARAEAIAAYTYTGVSSTLQQICREEGVRALMKGVVPRVFYSACFSALGFCVFETTRTFFLLKHIEQQKRPADIAGASNSSVAEVTHQVEMVRSLRGGVSG